MDYIYWNGSMIPFSKIDVDTSGEEFGASLQGIVDLFKSKADNRATQYVMGSVSLLVVSMVNENGKVEVHVYEVGDVSLAVNAPKQVLIGVLKVGDEVTRHASTRDKVNAIIDAYINTPRVF